MHWLDGSRIIAIFAVIFLHIAAVVVVSDNVGSAIWWVGNLYDSLVRWCVPVFVMISGALLLDPRKGDSIGDFYLRRASRVLIPTVFWSIFYLLWAFKGGLANGDLPPAKRVFKIISSGAPYYHMWFMFMIIPLYVFAPFMRKIISGSTRREIKVFVFVSFVFAAINAMANSVWGDPRLFINWFLSYMPYFFLGYLVSTDDEGISDEKLWAVFSLSVILTALGCFAVALKFNIFAGLYFYNYLSITVIPMSFSAIYLLKRYGQFFGGALFVRKISALTLGVYLIHPIFIELAHIAGLGPYSFFPGASIPIVALIVFISSLAFSFLISKTPYLRRTI